MSQQMKYTMQEENNNPVIAQMDSYDHEQIVFCQDNATGLKAIIGIHDTTLGPALGGTRMWMYDNEMEALRDVLRLSRGMTYKAAISGLNLGGGKAVIIGDAKTQKSEALFRRFGKFVDSLSGKYITAEDMGIAPRDMEYVHMETDYVTGLPESLGGSGDPSPVTAYGVFLGMKAAIKEQYGTDQISGKTVMVQGVGHVGEYLIKHITEEGGKVFISDINEKLLADVAKKYNATVVDTDKVYEAEADIYAPCAMGATINDETIPQFKFSVVAGSANNQLDNEQRHGQALKDKGIVYAPDFLINAGGIINVNREVAGYGQDYAMRHTRHIYDTTLDIFKRASTENITSHHAAMKIAKDRIENVGRMKLKR